MSLDVKNAFNTRSRIKMEESLFNTPSTHQEKAAARKALCFLVFAQNVDVLVKLTVRPSCIRIAAIRGKQLTRLSAVVLKLMSSM